MNNVTTMPLPESHHPDELDDDAGDLIPGVSEDVYTDDDMDTDRIAA